MWNRQANVIVWLMLVLAPLTGQTRIDLGRQGKGINFSGATATKPFQTGTSLPGVCTTGDTFFKTDGSPDKSLYTCSQSGAWALVGDDGVPAASGGANKVLSADGITMGWRALGGDIGGPPDAAQVRGIQGREIAPDAPASGQVLSWSSSSNRWGPVTPAPPSPGNFRVLFSGQASLTIAGSEHGLNSSSLISDCYIGNAPLLAVSGYQLSVDPSSYDVTITFPAGFTGTCVLNASGGGGVGSGYTLPTASASTLGGVMVGTGLSIASGVLSATGGGYTLPAATASVRGGIRVGSGLAMSGDVLSAPGGSGDVVGPAAAADGQLAVLNGTTGKAIRAASLSGVLKASGGVASVVGGGGKDCVYVDATSGPCAAGSSVSAGTGLSVAGSVVSVDTASVPSFLVASATLDFAMIAANACAIQTLSFPGAATGDSVSGGWPADMSTGIIPRILVATSNTAQIQLCNVTAGAIDPPARTYGATIVRSF